MPRKRLWIFGAFLWAVAGGPARDCLASAHTSRDTPSALSVFDAYLAEAAFTAPIYRTDLEVGGSSLELPAGRRFARGPFVGSFTYRAKTYRELSRDERIAMLREPQFRGFMLALRNVADQPVEKTALSSVAVTKAPAIFSFSIAPEEMLQRRQLFVVLPSPHEPR